MSNPKEKIITFKPQKCCQAMLNEIRDILEINKYITTILTISPFALLFGGKAKPSPASTIAFGKRDWDLFNKAISMTSVYTRTECRKICQLHQLKHRSGPDNVFWKEMEKAFKIQ